MRVTKVEIKNILRDARTLTERTGWRLANVYAYIYNGELKYFVHPQGQGTLEVIIKEKYEEMIYLTEYADKMQWNLKDATDCAYENVVDMVNEYLEEK